MMKKVIILLAILNTTLWADTVNLKTNIKSKTIDRGNSKIICQPFPECSESSVVIKIMFKPLLVKTSKKYAKSRTTGILRAKE